jgi:uncharacterized metal-binding protein
LPSGNVHNLINAGAFILLAATGYLSTRAGILALEPSQVTAFGGAFWAGTLLLSPDLDLATQGVNSKKAWGMWGWIWYPYGMVFTHRGLSHSYLFGPLTRILYLAAILIPLGYLLRPLILPTLHRFHLEHFQLEPGFWIALLLGYYLSQWLHLIADGIPINHGWRRLKHHYSRFLK